MKADMASPRSGLQTKDQEENETLFSTAWNAEDFLTPMKSK